MNISFFKRVRRFAFLACGLFATSMLTGCYAGLVGMLQSNVGGQTLPSAYYLRDDVQFFPTYGEEQLPRQKRLLDEYRLEQEALHNGGPVEAIP